MFAKKSLGQYFLRSRAALLKIAGAANLSRDDIALEVGPGEGALTELLLERAGKVIAVEKDARFIPLLQQKFSTDIVSGKFILIHADILNFDFSYYKLKAISYKLVANLPYYITGQFLRKFLEGEHQPQSMTLLLQKEVAKRIIAADGRESILSISVKCYGLPHYIATVKSSAFSPRPKVDSAIITIENISKEFFKDINEQQFFYTLKKGFVHPRKLLASNLGVAPEILMQYGITANARPENVTAEQWKRLARFVTTVRLTWLV